MSASNKALIIFIAIVAFFIGAALNSARVNDEIDTQTLLRAELSVPMPVVSNEASEQQYSPETINNLLGGKITLVNFWASWCAPCREEMPLFEAMYSLAKNQGFTIVGVAIDNPSNAQPMLDSMGITYPILYAEKTGIDVMASAGNPQGLLPYSLLIDAKGNVIDQILGAVHENDIRAWLNDANIDITQQPN